MNYPAAKLIEPLGLLNLPLDMIEHLCRERTNAVYVGDHQVKFWPLARYQFLTSTVVPLDNALQDLL